MPQLTARPPSRRRPLSHPADVSVRTSRPSLLDLRFSGDAWVVDPGQGPLVLCLGAHHLALINGLALDVPSLNGLLAQARGRRPRGHGRRR